MMHAVWPNNIFCFFLNARYDVSDNAICVILGGNAVDIPTTLGQESLPSQGGTSVTKVHTKGDIHSLPNEAL